VVIKKLPFGWGCHDGLALVGRLFKRNNLPAMIDPQYPARGGIANSDILKCYLGLLILGKKDCEAMEKWLRSAARMRPPYGRN
jgi:hypothetical protein